MQAASNRTFICSVVFLDIIGYSRKPVSEQIQLKERLNDLLNEALANVAINDRIILDTGDGAALNFLGDPEDALFVSLMLRDAIAAPVQQGPRLAMRIGINLGPVKLVKDINGQPNIIGDGINVAQRVMSFSEPGQVLVSRSYYEVVSCLAEEYAKLFHYEGSRTDKHVRDHEVYAVHAPSEALQRVAAAAPRKKTADTQGKLAVLDRLSHSAAFVTDNLRRKPRLGTVLAVIAILAVAVVLRLNRQPPAEPLASPASPKKVATAPVKEAPKEAAVEKSAVVPSREKATAQPAKKPASAPATTAKSPAKKEPDAKAETRPPASGGAGTIRLTIQPWGEIYVDGKHLGSVPPMYEFPLSAGRHRIEIQHPEFPSYVRTVDVTPGAKIDVRHWFQPKEQPNPLKMFSK